MFSPNYVSVALVFYIVALLFACQARRLAPGVNTDLFSLKRNQNKFDFDLKLHLQNFTFLSPESLSQVPEFPSSSYFKTALPELLYNVSIPIAHRCRLISNYKRIPDHARPPFYPRLESATSARVDNPGPDIEKIDILSMTDRTQEASCDLKRGQCSARPLVTLVTAASTLQDLHFLKQLALSWNGYISLALRISIAEIPKLQEWMANNKNDSDNNTDFLDKTIIHLIAVSGKKKLPPLTESSKDNGLLYRVAMEAAPTHLVWPVPIHFLPSPRAYERIYSLLCSNDYLTKKLYYTPTALVFHTLFSEKIIESPTKLNGFHSNKDGILDSQKKLSLFQDELEELGPFSDSKDRDKWINAHSPYPQSLDKDQVTYALLSKRSGALPKIINSDYPHLSSWFAKLALSGYTFYKESNIFLFSRMIYESHKSLLDMQDQLVEKPIGKAKKNQSEAYYKPSRPLILGEENNNDVDKINDLLKKCFKDVVRDDQSAREIITYDCKSHMYASIKLIEEASLEIDSGVWLYPNFASSKMLMHRNDVTMSLQLGASKFSLLQVLAISWPGPVSCAVYLENSKGSIKTLMGLILENEATFANWSFHIVVHNNETDPYYPNNMLRNIAMNSILTDFSFSMDIDFVPTHTLYEYFVSIIQDPYWGHVTRHERATMVVPAFEMQRKIGENNMDMFKRLPKAKQSLLRQLHSLRIQWFHKLEAPPGHRPTDYARWKSNNEIYQVKYQTNYEPYFLVEKQYSSILPNFEPRFRGFGRNKVAWVLELAAAGYSFFVIPSDFIVHLNHPTRKKRPTYLSTVMNSFYCSLVPIYGAELPDISESRKGPEKAQEIKGRLGMCPNGELKYSDVCVNNCIHACFKSFCRLE